jgi:4-hydroxybenzoate polyprenyltransferase
VGKAALSVETGLAAACAKSAFQFERREELHSAPLADSHKGCPYIFQGLSLQFSIFNFQFFSTMPPGMLKPLTTTLEMIKFQHTIFALPFAFLGAMTAAQGIPSLRVVFWIIVAMIGARSAAMAFNRLVDAEIDAKNPRTKSRAIPAGLLSRNFVLLFTIVSIGLFFLAAWQLNQLALILAPLALIVILGYSYTKRFTSMAHLVLGLALAIAPIGAAIAVEGVFNWRILPLAAAVLLWTAGFDILYSLQDVEFDRNAGLHSIPSRVGVGNALWISRLLHLLTVIALACFGYVNGFGFYYFIGVGFAIVLLLWQHSLVKANDLSRIDAAFFTANGMLSVIVFALGAVDILM